jgi:clan AA aspartic protease
MPRQGRHNPRIQVYADFTLFNPFNQRTVEIRALVDTGAMHVFVTEEVARQLGFDTEEVTRDVVILADETRREVPSLGCLQLSFGERRCYTKVLVLGDECLVGVLPLEGMYLVVDPTALKLTLGRQRPDGPRGKW